MKLPPIEPVHWHVAPAPYGVVRRLAEALQVSDVVAQVLARRGLTDPEAARAFLRPDHRVHGPYLMAGIGEARRRVDVALRRGEHIAVHGDYDADGITATHLLVSVLRDLGADVRWYLPNRFVDGYGISTAAVEELAAAGVTLIITVDCGVTARAEVARARELGVDVIVTDHHEIDGDVPECTVVTPKLPGYPFPHLAGVGVALKLAHALLEDPSDDRVEVPLALRPFTDVVAVGTIADLVPLVDENRTLAAMGLGRLRSSPRPGLAALLEASGTDAASCTAGVVGFRLAPRLNAAGRLQDASLALELLEAGDRETALPLALRLDEMNRERQEVEAGIFAAAVAQVPDPLPAALVLSAPDWHEGVVGIVASRVAERFNRPAVLLAEDGEHAKGSGRSIPAYDLLAGVQSGAAHLLTCGGHRAACGLSLRCADIPAFREALTAHAAHALTSADLRRVRPLDAVVCGDELTLAVADELEALAPHGVGNPQPVLLLHAARVRDARRTRDRRHLRYRVDCDGACASAVQFDAAEAPADLAGGRFDVPLTLGKNSYNGTVSAQVRVRALRRLGHDGPDLCATACAAACRDRLITEALWRELVEGPAPRVRDDDAAALMQARREARLRDGRGRPIVSSLAALAATGERMVVLVADVGRRRPLLTRDVLSAPVAARGLYLHPACVAARAPLAAHVEVVMTTVDVALCRPELLAAVDHVAFVDPPASAVALAAVAAVSPRAVLHALWGEGEVQLTRKVQAAHGDLDAALRRVWRRLAAAEGRFGEAVEQELVGEGPYLGPVPLTAASVRCLAEAGLLLRHEEGWRLERPEVKADLPSTDTYRTWRRLSHSPEFLTDCLTQPV